MSYIIRSKGNVANTPYVIPGMKISIYSVEELSYFIYTYASLCDTMLQRSDLHQWLLEECNLPKLYEQLKQLVSDNAAPDKIAMAIFQDTEYLDKEECIDTCTQIRNSYAKSIYQRKKERADHLLSHGHFEEAIRFYEVMLKDKTYDDKAMWEDISYNISCCYAKMFYYDIAADMFIKLYQEGTHSKKVALAALSCKALSKQGTLDDFCIKNPFLIQYLSESNQMMQDVHEKWEQSEEKKSINSLGKTQGVRNIDYYKDITKRLNQWKQDIK